MGRREHDETPRWGKFTPSKADRAAAEADLLAKSRRGEGHPRPAPAMVPPALSEKSKLLGVDLGLATGMALFNRDGRLDWVRSRDFASRDSLRKGVHETLERIPHLAIVVAEGGGTIAESWQRACEHRGIRMRLVQAETWRPRFFFPREHRDSDTAKKHAIRMARQVVAWSGTKGVGDLDHDAAEAVLVGLHGVIEAGWLPEPPGLKHA